MLGLNQRPATIHLDRWLGWLRPLLVCIVVVLPLLLEQRVVDRLRRRLEQQVVDRRHRRRALAAAAAVVELLLLRLRCHRRLAPALNREGERLRSALLTLLLLLVVWAHVRLGLSVQKIE